MTDQEIASIDFEAQLDERQYVARLIRTIVDECPRRQPTSRDELRAQQIMQDELGRLGFQSYLEGFQFNDSLYANLALHFGLGTAGTLVSGMAPAMGFVLHALAGTSFFLDSTRRAFVLRRLFPYRPSQNLVVTLPADGEPELRIVVMGHIDAAFTGILFHPKLIRSTNPDSLPRPLRFLGRTLAVPTYSQFVLAGFDLARIYLGPLTWPLRPLEALLTVPALVAFVINMQLVLQDQIVPGANDDLTGVAAVALLARRLAPFKPANVEMVFAITGAEEASMGGAQALLDDRRKMWDKEKTVVIALDGLSGGELRYFEEGELWRVPVPGWLGDLIREVADMNPKVGSVLPFAIPSGATDVLPFRYAGYDGVGIGCVDPSIQAPRHYHQMTDSPENVDPDDVILALDFTEKLVRAIVHHRLGVFMQGAGEGRDDRGPVPS